MEWEAAQVRQARWGLQDEARKLLPKERVALCMRQIRRDLDVVGVHYVPSQQSAHYGGLMACGSVWTCPVCAAKVTERRRQELLAAITKARASHLRVVMVTYTFSHHRGDHLGEMMKAMSGAFKRYKGGRAAMDLRKRFAIIGTVRALEVTHSERNGWHPHVHELVFMPQEIDVEAFAQACRSAWERAAAAYGLQMNEHGFQVDDCDQRIADYITKWGHEPKKDGWNEAAELTKWHVKKGRMPMRGRDEHITPFGLLRYAAAGDERAGALFVEYAGRFKGMKQLHWSRDLRAMLDLGEEQSDEELAEEQREEAMVLAQVDRSGWAMVLGNDARCELLEVARSGNPEQVGEFLEALGLLMNEAGAYCDPRFRCMVA